VFSTAVGDDNASKGAGAFQGEAWKTKNSSTRTSLCTVSHSQGLERTLAGKFHLKLNSSRCTVLKDWNATLAGKFHLKLNIGSSPITNKYSEGKVEWTFENVRCRADGLVCLWI
jgi:hypothetical protein